MNKVNIIYIIILIKIILAQKPKLLISKKSIANFKLRVDDIIGVKVNLSNRNLYNFLDLTITTVLPSIKNLNKLVLHDNNLNFSINNLYLYKNIESTSYITRLFTGIYICLLFNSKDKVKNKFLLNSLKIPIIL